MTPTIDEFATALYVEGLAERTIQIHTSRIKYFIERYGDFTPATINRWIVDVRKAGWKNNSINSYLKTVKKWGKFIGDEVLASWKFLPPNATLKATLSEEEITAFLNLKADYTGRQKAHIKRFEMFTVIFYILSYTGARTHEVMELTAGQVDLGQALIAFYATKTHDVRYVPIHPDLKIVLEAFITDLKASDSLFPNMHKDSLRKQFKSRLNRLGIDRPGLTPYCLRRSFITRQLDNDANLFTVKALVGHKKTETTERYYALTQKKLRKVVKKDPLGRKHLTKQEKLAMIIESLESLGMFTDPDLEITTSSDQILIK